MILTRLWQSIYDPLGEVPAGLNKTRLPSPIHNGETIHVERIDVLPAVDGCTEGIYVHDGQLRMSIPELYHRLQNLSSYPQALPLARRFYLTQLSRNTSKSSDGILSLPTRFNPTALRSWLLKVSEITTAKFERYVERRRAGGAREMFRDREDAVRWCRESAVVKYVDGAWIHGVYRHNVSGPSRKAARTTWQVLSEELGDGDLERSHVAAYERLMDDLGGAPRGYERDLISWLAVDGEQPNKQPWIAGLLQLCASISPTEFLPEILGFNLSYESLPLHLLVTSRELRELKIDPYYFILHISIDNGHSGHSAMARIAIEYFLKEAEITHGAKYADKLWRRIQAGYNLADSARTTPRTWTEGSTTPAEWNEGICIASDEIAGARIAKTVLQLFRDKAAATIGLHAGSRAVIGDKPISHWLDPAVLDTEGEQFMTALANSKAWIQPGHPEESRFVKATTWGGKMFGAFTKGEVQLLCDWIKNLPISATIDYTHRLGPSAGELENDYVERYADVVGAAPKGNLQPINLTSLVSNVASWRDWEQIAPEIYAAIVNRPDAQRHWTCELPFGFLSQASCTSSLELFAHLDKFPLGINMQYNSLIPSLITAPLEWISCSYPAKLNSPMGMCLVKVLRILYGFTESSGEGCMGTDDVFSAQPGVRELFPSTSNASDFALPALILALNSRPETHLPILLGITVTLVHCFLGHPNVTCGLDRAARKRMERMVEGAIFWLKKVIDFGFEPKAMIWDGSPQEWGCGLSLGVAMTLKGLAPPCESAKH